jgi:hypothetical protein
MLQDGNSKVERFTFNQARRKKNRIGRGELEGDKENAVAASN